MTVLIISLYKCIFKCHMVCIGGGNGNPPQYSCLENPRDGGAWWAAFYGVAQSWTWLKQLSSSSKEQLIIVVTIYTLQWARGDSWMCFEQGSTALQADSSPSEPPGKLLEYSVSGILSRSLSWLWLVLIGCGCILLHELQWLEGTDSHPFQVPM